MFANSRAIKWAVWKNINMAQPFQDSGQGPFESPDFRTPFRNCFDTIVISGFSTSIPPRQVVDFFNLKEGHCVCLEAKTNPPSIVLRFTSPVVARNVCLKYNNADVYGYKLTIFPASKQYTSQRDVQEPAEIPPMAPYLGNVQPFVGSSLFNLARAIVISREQNKLQNHLHTNIHPHSLQSSQQKTFPANRSSSKDNQAKNINKKIPWKPHGQPPIAQKGNDRNSTPGNRCPLRDVEMSKNGEKLQNDSGYEKCPDDERINRTEGSKGPITKRKRGRRRSREIYTTVWKDSNAGRCPDGETGEGKIETSYQKTVEDGKSSKSESLEGKGCDIEKKCLTDKSGRIVDTTNKGQGKSLDGWECNAKEKCSTGKSLEDNGRDTEKKCSAGKINEEGRDKKTTEEQEKSLEGKACDNKKNCSAGKSDEKVRDNTTPEEQERSMEENGCHTDKGHDGTPKTKDQEKSLEENGCGSEKKYSIVKNDDKGRHNRAKEKQLIGGSKNNETESQKTASNNSVGENERLANSTENSGNRKKNPCIGSEKEWVTSGKDGIEENKAATAKQAGGSCKNDAKESQKIASTFRRICKDDPKEDREQILKNSRNQNTYLLVEKSAGNREREVSEKTEPKEIGCQNKDRNCESENDKSTKRFDAGMEYVVNGSKYSGSAKNYPGKRQENSSVAYVHRVNENRNKETVNRTTATQTSSASANKLKTKFDQQSVYNAKNDRPTKKLTDGEKSFGNNHQRRYESHQTKCDSKSSRGDVNYNNVRGNILVKKSSSTTSSLQRDDNKDSAKGTTTKKFDEKRNSSNSPVQSCDSRNLWENDGKTSPRNAVSRNSRSTNDRYLEKSRREDRHYSSGKKSERFHRHRTSDGRLYHSPTRYKTFSPSRNSEKRFSPKSRDTKYFGDRQESRRSPNSSRSNDGRNYDYVRARKRGFADNAQRNVSPKRRYLGGSTIVPEDSNRTIGNRDLRYTLIDKNLKKNSAALTGEKSSAGENCQKDNNNVMFGDGENASKLCNAPRDSKTKNQEEKESSSTTFSFGVENGKSSRIGQGSCEGVFNSPDFRKDLSTEKQEDRKVCLVQTSEEKNEKMDGGSICKDEREDVRLKSPDVKKDSSTREKKGGEPTLSETSIRDTTDESCGEVNIATRENVGGVLQRPGLVKDFPTGEKKTADETTSLENSEKINFPTDQKDESVLNSSNTVDDSKEKEESISRDNSDMSIDAVAALEKCPTGDNNCKKSSWRVLLDEPVRSYSVHPRNKPSFWYTFTNTSTINDTADKVSKESSLEENNSSKDDQKKIDCRNLGIRGNTMVEQKHFERGKGPLAYGVNKHVEGSLEEDGDKAPQSHPGIKLLNKTSDGDGIQTSRGQRTPGIGNTVLTIESESMPANMDIGLDDILPCSLLNRADVQLEKNTRNDRQHTRTVFDGKSSRDDLGDGNDVENVEDAVTNVAPKKIKFSLKSSSGVNLARLKSLKTSAQKTLRNLDKMNVGSGEVKTTTVETSVSQTNLQGDSNTSQKTPLVTGNIKLSESKSFEVKNEIVKTVQSGGQMVTTVSNCFSHERNSLLTDQRDDDFTVDKLKTSSGKSSSGPSEDSSSTNRGSTGDGQAEFTNSAGPGFVQIKDGEAVMKDNPETKDGWSQEKNSTSFTSNVEDGNKHSVELSRNTSSNVDTLLQHFELVCRLKSERNFKQGCRIDRNRRFTSVNREENSTPTGKSVHKETGPQLSQNVPSNTVLTSCVLDIVKRFSKAVESTSEDDESGINKETGPQLSQNVPLNTVITSPVSSIVKRFSRVVESTSEDDESVSQETGPQLSQNVPLNTAVTSPVSGIVKRFSNVVESASEDDESGVSQETGPQLSQNASLNTVTTSSVSSIVKRFSNVVESASEDESEDSQCSQVMHDPNVKSTSLTETALPVSENSASSSRSKAPSKLEPKPSKTSSDISPNSMKNMTIRKHGETYSSDGIGFKNYQQKVENGVYGITTNSTSAVPSEATVPVITVSDYTILYTTTKEVVPLENGLDASKTPENDVCSYETVLKPDSVQSNPVSGLSNLKTTGTANMGPSQDRVSSSTESNVKSLSNSAAPKTCGGGVKSCTQKPPIGQVDGNSFQNDVHGQELNSNCFESLEESSERDIEAANGKNQPYSQLPNAAQMDGMGFENDVNGQSLDINQFTQGSSLDINQFTQSSVQTGEGIGEIENKQRLKSVDESGQEVTQNCCQGVDYNRKCVQNVTDLSQNELGPTSIFQQFSQTCESVNNGEDFVQKGKEVGQINENLQPAPITMLKQNIAQCDRQCVNVDEIFVQNFVGGNNGGNFLQSQKDNDQSDSEQTLNQSTKNDCEEEKDGKKFLRSGKNLSPNENGPRVNNQSETTDKVLQQTTHKNNQGGSNDEDVVQNGENINQSENSKDLNNSERSREDLEQSVESSCQGGNNGGNVQSGKCVNQNESEKLNSLEQNREDLHQFTQNGGGLLHETGQAVNDDILTDDKIAGKRKREEDLETDKNKYQKIENPIQNNGLVRMQKEGSSHGSTSVRSRKMTARQRCNLLRERKIMSKKIKSIEQEYNKESFALLKSVKLLASTDPSLTEKLKVAFQESLVGIGEKLLLKLHRYKKLHDNSKKQGKNYSEKQKNSFAKQGMTSKGNVPQSINSKNLPQGNATKNNSQNLRKMANDDVTQGNSRNQGKMPRGKSHQHISKNERTMVKGNVGNSISENKQERSCRKDQPSKRQTIGQQG